MVPYISSAFLFASCLFLNGCQTPPPLSAAPTPSLPDHSTNHSDPRGLPSQQQKKDLYSSVKTNDNNNPSRRVEAPKAEKEKQVLNQTPEVTTLHDSISYGNTSSSTAPDLKNSSQEKTNTANGKKKFPQYSRPRPLSPEDPNPSSAAKPTSSSASPRSPLWARQLDRVLAKYKTASGLRIQIIKEVYSGLLEETQASQGVLYISGHKMRVDFSTPQKQSLILDGKYIWMENQTQGFDKNIQVTKVRVDNALQKSNALLALLLSDKPPWHSFRKIKTKNNDHKKALATNQRHQNKLLKKITLAPRRKNKHSEINQLEIQWSKKSQEIASISYEDNVENKTTYIFKKQNLNQKLDPALFQYSPPKGAEVTEF